MIELFPLYPGWGKAILGDLCDIRGGSPAPQNDEAFAEGEIPFVRMKDVGRHHFTSNLCETDQALSRSHFHEGRYELTPRGSILMPRSGSVGLNHRAILGMDAVIVSHLCALVLRTNKITTDFLYRFLCLADMRKLTKKTTGLDSIAFSDLRLIAIPLPPLAEQRRIAEVLDRAEALRAKRRAALAQLDNLTQSLFLDLFGDPISNPKAWPETTVLGDIADIVSGITKGRKLNGDKVRRVPYLAVANVQDRALNLAAINSIEATDKEIARYRLQLNDLVLTEGGDPDKLGRGTLWRGEISECIHQNHIFRVRLLSERVAPMFANWLISGPRGKKYFLKSAKQTTGIASINMTQLRGFPLLIPPITLQREFGRYVTAVEKLKVKQRASLAELDALFSSLQHRAFRGKL